MLQQAIYVIYISLLCILWGIPALLYVNKNKQEFLLSQLMPGILFFLFFSGLITLSVISAWICLFVPLNFQSLLVSTGCLVLYLLLFQREKIPNPFKEISFKSHLSALHIFFIIITIMVFILLGTLKTVNRDTHIYHTQIILWFNEYGSVPGIANLFPRFGLGSNWLNLISLFRFPFLITENFSYLNTTLVIWFFLWLFFKWKGHSKNYNSNATGRTLSLFYLLIILFCLFEWELFRDSANSANYDFIVTALFIIITSFFIENILIHKSYGQFSLLFIILCIAVIPIKLSGIFILLPLFLYLYNHFSVKRILMVLFAGLIIIIPLFIKNYIVSGYPLYPLSFSFLHPDWQVPGEMVDYIKKYIVVTNRFYNAEIDFTKIAELVNKPWIISWYNGILLQHRILIAASISTGILFFIKPDKSVDFKKLRILFFILILMEAGWFFTAPSPRFGYGIFLITGLFPVSLLAASKLHFTFHNLFLAVSVFFSCYYLYKKSTPLYENKSLLIYPEVIAKPPVSTININGNVFYLPGYINNDYMRICYNTPLPCICQENKYLIPRGKSLKDGFRMKPKPDSIFIKNYNY